MKCCNHLVVKQGCQCHNCSGYLCETGKQMRKGKITCASCNVPVVTGTKIKLMFCPNTECINSEDNYLK